LVGQDVVATLAVCDFEALHQVDVEDFIDGDLEARFRNHHDGHPFAALRLGAVDTRQRGLEAFSKTCDARGGDAIEPREKDVVGRPCPECSRECVAPMAKDSNVIVVSRWRHGLSLRWARGGANSQVYENECGPLELPQRRLLVVEVGERGVHLLMPLLVFERLVAKKWRLDGKFAEV